MALTQLPLPHLSPPSPPPGEIPPGQVWTTLSPGQHQQVQEAVIAICREIFLPGRPLSRPEAPHD